MPEKPTLFTRKDLKRVKAYPNQHIGSGVFGNVYLDRAYFKAEGSKKQVVKRVAVKNFIKPIDESRVRQYEQVIERLEKEGVRLPKNSVPQSGGQGMGASSGALRKEEKIQDKQATDFSHAP